MSVSADLCSNCGLITPKEELADNHGMCGPCRHAEDDHYRDTEANYDDSGRRIS